MTLSRSESAINFKSTASILFPNSPKEKEKPIPRMDHSITATVSTAQRRVVVVVVVVVGVRFGTLVGILIQMLLRGRNKAGDK